MPTSPSRYLTALACLAAAGLSACSTARSGSSAAARSGPNGGVIVAPTYEVDHASWQELGFRWEWNARPPMGAGRQMEYAHAYDDVVLVQDTGSMVSVIENATGKVRWFKQVRDTVTRFVGTSRQGDSIYVANETELFELAIQTGNTLDRTDLNTIATTRPVMFDELAVFGTAAGRLIAMDTDNDVRIWEYQFDGLLESPPVRVDDFTVAAVSTTGDIRALDIDSARTQASARISGDAGGDLVTDGELLFIGSLDQSVYAFDLFDGSRAWRHRSAGQVTVQPTLIDETLYATTTDSGLIAFDIYAGEQAWNNPEIGGWVVTTVDGDLIVWTGRGIARLDAENGDVIARIELPGVSGVRSNAPVDGEIFVISAEGAVAKFSAR
ncbi:MAG: PQQ-binding-like beta-propeller repeat protein [Planctomycetota bacterium]